MPLAVDSFGRMGEEVACFRDGMDDMAVANCCASKAAIARIVRQKLSRALCPGNAHMYELSQFRLHVV